MIVDFDGDPGVALSARSVKRSPLADVAGDDPFACSPPARRPSGSNCRSSGVAKPEAVDAWQQAAEFWSLWTSSAFLQGLPGERRPRAGPAAGQSASRWISCCSSTCWKRRSSTCREWTRRRIARALLAVALRADRDAAGLSDHGLQNRSPHRFFARSSTAARPSSRAATDTTRPALTAASMSSCGRVEDQLPRLARRSSGVRQHERNRVGVVGVEQHAASCRR